MGRKKVTEGTTVAEAPIVIRGAGRKPKAVIGVEVTNAAGTPIPTSLIESPPVSSPSDIRFLAPDELDLGINSRIVVSSDTSAKDKSLAVQLFREGQLVPVIAVASEDGGKPKLLGGNRRYRAAKLLRTGFQWDEGDGGFPIDVFVPDFKLKVDVLPAGLSAWQEFTKSVTENVREEVTDVEEARAHEYIRKTFGKGDVDIQKLYGYASFQRIQHLKALLELDPRVIELVDEKKLSLHAANQTAGLEQATLDAIIETARNGGKVKATDVAEAKQKDKAEKGEDETPAATLPRNAKAFTTFLDTYVLHKENVDSFPESVVKLAKAIKVYLKGEKTDVALNNAFEALK